MPRSTYDDPDPMHRARSRAMRAARAVTFGIALAGGAAAATACSSSHEPGGDAGPTPDGAMAEDAGPCTDPTPETRRCCNEIGGIWDPEHGCAVAVPGPFVPPDVPA